MEIEQVLFQGRIILTCMGTNKTILVASVYLRLICDDPRVQVHPSKN